MRTVIIPTLALALAFPHERLAADEGARHTHVVVDRRGLITIDVQIADAGPFSFVLDTGSARSLVSDDLARALRAVPIAQSDLVTSAGTERVPIVRLAHVRVPPMQVETLLAPVVRAQTLAPLGPHVRGVLGQDFLSAFNYTLDYRRGRLTWDEPSSCEGPDAVHLSPTEGRYVVAASDGSPRPLRLVPDTGTETLVLFRAPPSGTPDVTLSGLLGTRPVHSEVLPRLSFGSIRMSNIKAVAVDRRNGGADGLLPLHVFSSVSFAARGGCLVVRK